MANKEVCAIFCTFLSSILLAAGWYLAVQGTLKGHYTCEAAEREKCGRVFAIFWWPPFFQLLLGTAVYILKKNATLHQYVVPLNGFLVLSTFGLIQNAEMAFVYIKFHEDYGVVGMRMAAAGFSILAVWNLVAMVFVGRGKLGENDENRANANRPGMAADVERGIPMTVASV